MTERPIAVVITCHDLGRTLQEALDSVKRQTRSASEIVIVDDGSSDLYTRQALARVERYGTRVIQTDGLGASAARNVGARSTSSDYLVWLDADDMLEPEYLSVAGARLDQDHSIDFVSCAMRAFGEARYLWTPSALTFIDAISTGAVPHASTMIRRRTWETAGGFDESLRSFELLDFWARVFECQGRGVVLDAPLLNYRVRAQSAYRRSITFETYHERLLHFYTKHQQAISRHWPSLLEHKEAFLLSQREHRRALESTAKALEAQLTQLILDIDGTVRALNARGMSRVEWGDFRRTQPISSCWGVDRGTPIDRYYIEGFLDRHRSDVRGRVLEVSDSIYTYRYGGAAVTANDVLDINAENERATIVSDLRNAVEIASNTYNCIVLTQVLQFIDDPGAALSECFRILHPGGVLLLTAPGIIRVDDESGPDGDYSRLTEASARALFANVFPIDAFEVTTFGNVGSCAAFLHGLSVEETRAADLDPVDPTFPMVVAVRAVKPPSVTSPLTSRTRTTSKGAVILAYHRVSSLYPDGHRLCTPPDLFSDHMTHLAQHYQPVSVEDLAYAVASGRIPERAVAVTFDDGYLDALSTASPILASLGIPATFFVNSDRLNEKHERWWDILESLNLPEAEIEHLSQAMWRLDAAGRQALLEATLERVGVTMAARATHRVMTSDEIRTLASRPGHTIGAHTVNHLALANHPLSVKQLEVLTDKATLEQTTGKAVTLFSYPYGDLDAELVSVVRDAGFIAAVTVAPSIVLANSDRLLLPRYEIPHDQHHRFSRWLSEIFR